MIEFRAERPIWSDSLDLYGKQTIDGRHQALVAEGIKLVDVTQGHLWPRFLSIPLMQSDGQSLFDALWNAGYRPNGGESSIAHVAAMRAHLEDMRTLVFKPPAAAPDKQEGK